ncbi:electron transporter SenC [Novosphingobium barchaimii]|nr:electron transporter SenC [Novosphingobium barchaimii]
MIRILTLLLCLIAPPAAAQAQAGFDPFGEAGIDDRQGARVPLAVPLTDAQGRRTTLRALGGGKPILLVPVLHNCPNICGVTLAGVADAIKDQPLRPGKDFALVAFSIDPKEAPKDAAADLARLREREGMQTLPASAVTGSADAIHAVTRAIGYRYAWDQRIGQYAHVAAVAVLTPEGRLAGWLYGIAPKADDLSRALTDARNDRAASWGEKLLLLCFHYDPVTGRYTASIVKALRIAGVITALSVGLLLWRLRRRGAA